jgi:hypothetical protein
MAVHPTRRQLALALHNLAIIFWNTSMSQAREITGFWMRPEAMHPNNSKRRLTTF